MRRLLILLALLLPVTGRACPNILLGDSLAEGMAPYARADGWEVIARRGAGLSWVRTVAPRCVGALVVVIGTNDLPSMTEEVARAYPARVAEMVGWWRPERAVWALPACFPARPAMERASAWLDAVAEPSGLTLSRGRPARCEAIGGDGIHPSDAGYSRWWREMRAQHGHLPAEVTSVRRHWPRPAHSARLLAPLSCVNLALAASDSCHAR